LSPSFSPSGMHLEYDAEYRPPQAWCDNKQENKVLAPGSNPDYFYGRLSVE
jgi:hypothetical protein